MISRRVAFAVLLFCTGCATTPSDDQVLATRLVGKWSRVTYLGEKRVEDTTELKRDGSMRVTGVVHEATGSRRFFAIGSWRVEKGCFVETIHHSDFPGWKPANADLGFPIVSVSEWEWVRIENQGGAEGRRWRYPR
jgi:hypothetical protein